MSAWDIIRTPCSFSAQAHTPKRGPNLRAPKIYVCAPFPPPLFRLRQRVLPKCEQQWSCYWNFSGCIKVTLYVSMLTSGYHDAFFHLLKLPWKSKDGGFVSWSILLTLWLPENGMYFHDCQRVHLIDMVQIQVLKARRLHMECTFVPDSDLWPPEVISSLSRAP